VLHSPSGEPRARVGLDIATAAGLFDPSVQALWEARGLAHAPPRLPVIAKARAEVDWRRFGSGPTRSAPERSTSHAQRPRPGLCHRPGRGPFIHRLGQYLVDLGGSAIEPRQGGAPRLVARPMPPDRTN
jgi:hypothetical protein